MKEGAGEESKPKVNRLLGMALGIFESVVPGALADPEKALRDVTPRLRYLVIEKAEKPSLEQLEAVRALDPNRNLVQIRKAMQAGNLQYGPFLNELAEGMMAPCLKRVGLGVSIRELTEEEKARVHA